MKFRSKIVLKPKKLILYANNNNIYINLKQIRLINLN